MGGVERLVSNGRRCFGSSKTRLRFLMLLRVISESGLLDDKCAPLLTQPSGEDCLNVVQYLEGGIL
jgi:hypothetical protein